MAPEPESAEVRRLLHATARHPDGPPDLAAIRRGVRRRRSTRRGLGGVAALGAAAVLGLVVAPDDDPTTEVHVANETDTTVVEEPIADPAVLPGALAAEGIAVQTADGVELLSLDGTSLHTLDDYELATEGRDDGLVDPVTNVVPLRDPTGALAWLDPATGRLTAVGPGGGTPLWDAVEVAVDPERGIRAVSDQVTDWYDTDEWRLSSDHRVVTITDLGIYDSASGSLTTYMPGCWVAAREDGTDAVICESGDATTITPMANGVGTAAALPLGTDGQPRRATAAWIVGSNLLVRAEQESCFIADAMVVRDGQVFPLMGPTPAANPSSAPIGVASDDRAIVHLNEAACDASSEDPGVYLVDLETGERERVWRGAAQLWEVRAWTTLPLQEMEEDAPVAPPHDELRLADLEVVAPEEIGRDVLIFGDQGTERVSGGQRAQVWSVPVVRAADDGAGGLVLQDSGDDAAIWHLAAGATTPRQLVGPEEHPELWSVAGGEAWITTGDTTGMDPDDTEPQMLVAVALETGALRTIGQSGGYDTGLDGVAHLGDGRSLFSTCHLQCSIRRSLNDADPIVLPQWLGGLDGSTQRWAYVHFTEWTGDGSPSAPVFTVHDLADAAVAQVPLPGEIGWQTFVDLSDDGTAALVWTQDWQTPAVTGPVLVEGLDTDSPRVRRLDAGGQAVRFG